MSSARERAAKRGMRDLCVPRVEGHGRHGRLLPGERDTDVSDCSHNVSEGGNR